MRKATIIYHSSTGTTEEYAHEIGGYLAQKGLETQIASITDFQDEMLTGAEFVFFGCWTSGLFIMAQKPELSWVEFARRIPSKLDAKIALFTTYKLLTGSMFRNMYKELDEKYPIPTLELKSRGPSLTEKNRIELDRFLC